MEQSDLLMLLAALAGWEDYEIPADRLADWLEEATVSSEPRQQDPAVRRLQVAAMAEALGGDVS
jgi:hypothetical protein